MDAVRELMYLLTDGEVRDVEGMDIETMARIVDEHYEAKYESRLRFHRDVSSELQRRFGDAKAIMADAMFRMDQAMGDVRV